MAAPSCRYGSGGISVGRGPRTCGNTRSAAAPIRLKLARGRGETQRVVGSATNVIGVVIVLTVILPEAEGADFGLFVPFRGWVAEHPRVHPVARLGFPAV